MKRVKSQLNMHLLPEKKSVNYFPSSDRIFRQPVFSLQYGRGHCCSYSEIVQNVQKNSGEEEAETTDGSIAYMSNNMIIKC